MRDQAACEVRGIVAEDSRRTGGARSRLLDKLWPRAFVLNECTWRTTYWVLRIGRQSHLELSIYNLLPNPYWQGMKIL